MSKSIKLTNDTYWDKTSIKKLGYITVGLSANTSYTLTSSWSYTNVTFDTVRYSNNIFTLKNNGIVIPAGVSKIRVSGQGMSNGNVYRIFQIYKNSSVISGGYQSTSTDNNSYLTTTISPVIINVTEGDVIYMKYGSGNYNGSTTTMALAGNHYTYLTVEEIL